MIAVREAGRRGFILSQQTICMWRKNLGAEPLICIADLRRALASWSSIGSD